MKDEAKPAAKTKGTVLQVEGSASAKALRTEEVSNLCERSWAGGCSG